MAIAHSKVTAQGQISIPAEVRKQLGIGAGSILEWETAGDQILIRRVADYSSEDIHHALFGSNPPAPKTLKQMKEGIANYARKRYARD